MATKTDFSESEWKAIVGALPMTGLAVACASPNGPFGMMKEMMSVALTVADVMKAGSSTPIIQAIVDDMKARGTKPEMPADIKTTEAGSAAALAHLKTVAASIDAKCSAEEAAAFKKWLVALAQRVAEASNEGGFFGFGGVRVSDAEKKAISEVEAALGGGNGDAVSGFSAGLLK